MLYETVYVIAGVLQELCVSVKQEMRLSVQIIIAYKVA